MKKIYTSVLVVVMLLCGGCTTGMLGGLGTGNDGTGSGGTLGDVLGGVLGFLPDLVCATVAGMQMSDLHSPWFYIIIAINLLICALAYLFYRAYRRRCLARRERRPFEV